MHNRCPNRLRQTGQTAWRRFAQAGGRARRAAVPWSAATV